SSNRALTAVQATPAPYGQACTPLSLIRSKLYHDLYTTLPAPVRVLPGSGFPSSVPFGSISSGPSVGWLVCTSQFERMNEITIKTMRYALARHLQLSGRRQQSRHKPTKGEKLP
ncbi:MAG: hypothetical protein OQK71_06675, partial [Desulfobacter sp.]|nr:hypothetical protein [Desulfobacter sp.]